MDLELDTLHLMSRYAIGSSADPKPPAISVSSVDSKYVRSATRRLLKGDKNYPQHVQDAFNSYVSSVLQYRAAEARSSALQKEYAGLDEPIKQGCTLGATATVASKSDIESMTVRLLGAPADPAQAVKKGLNIKVHRPQVKLQSARGEK
jgi:hypothetical protein